MKLSCIILPFFISSLTLVAQQPQITIQADKPGSDVSPSLYGSMTEEINHSYDGGLYAELIRNRAFRDNPTTPEFWMEAVSGTGKVRLSLDKSNPVNTVALGTSLRVDVDALGQQKRAGVANEGFWGVPIQPHIRYTASFYAQAQEGFSGALTVALESADGSTQYVTGVTDALDKTWKKYTVIVTTPESAPSTAAGRFALYAGSTGAFRLSLVSLFPPTYNNRPNGLRIDLMEKMAAMKPAFIRLPGGNYLEGPRIQDHFPWKQTLGPLEERPGHAGSWNYPVSDGMGLLEFLEWCEDLKAEPLLAVFAGYSLRGEVVSKPEDLKPFIDEALDEIEFVSGPITTTWGKKRAELGHPKPFPLHYVEIGNEDFFDHSGSYDIRFAQYFDAIRARYPQLKLIATAKVTSRVPDFRDDHIYTSVMGMLRAALQNDKEERTPTKIMWGEWATTVGSPTPILMAGLSDAAWLTSMERNSDNIRLTSYAPLLVNVNKGASQWGTNLIGYDSLTSFGSPSYWVQCMFMQNRGDFVLPLNLEANRNLPEMKPHLTGQIGFGDIAGKSDFRDLVIIEKEVPTTLKIDSGLTDWQTGKGTWSAENGVLVQNKENKDTHAISSKDNHWGDYTLQARGRLRDGDTLRFVFRQFSRRDFLALELASSARSVTNFVQMCEGQKVDLWKSSDLKIEKNQWYSIQVELKGDTIRVNLDGKELCRVTTKNQPGLPALYASCNLEKATHEAILKVVNMSAEPISPQISLQGVKAVSSTARMVVLSGQDGQAINSVAETEKIKPVESIIPIPAPTFTHEFPGQSVSVIRIKLE